MTDSVTIGFIEQSQYYSYADADHGAQHQVILGKANDNADNGRQREVEDFFIAVWHVGIIGLDAWE